MEIRITGTKKEIQDYKNNFKSTSCQLYGINNFYPLPNQKVPICYWNCQNCMIIFEEVKLRANKGESYYFIALQSGFPKPMVLISEEKDSVYDEANFNISNYFQTEQEAQDKLDEILEIFKKVEE